MLFEQYKSEITGTSIMKHPQIRTIAELQQIKQGGGTLHNVLILGLSGLVLFKLQTKKYVLICNTISY